MWKGCRGFLVSWPASGPRRLKVARPICCRCASTRRSLGICVFGTCLCTRFGPSLPCVSTLNGDWLVFCGYDSLQAALWDHESQVYALLEAVVRGTSEMQPRRSVKIISSLFHWSFLVAQWAGVAWLLLLLIGLSFNALIWRYWTSHPLLRRMSMCMTLTWTQEKTKTSRI